MLLEWDEDKARRNLEKHGVAFDIVSRLSWDEAEAIEDDRFNYGERRFISASWSRRDCTSWSTPFAATGGA